VTDPVIASRCCCDTQYLAEIAKLSTTVKSSSFMSGNMLTTDPLCAWIDGNSVVTTKVIGTPNIVSLRLASRSEDRAVETTG
jgi:hypothetical protein